MTGSRHLGSALLIFIFLAPGLLIYSAFLVAPVVQASWYSFFSWNGFGSPEHFVGTANYASVFVDPLFWRAFVNNLFLIGFMFVTLMPLAFGLAVLIAAGTGFAVGFRLIYFMPFIFADITAGLIWRYLLDGDYGLIAMLGDDMHILADPQLALPAIATVMVWKSFGFHLVLFIAGLQQIDSSLYEAAEIDGANAWQRLWRITIPLMGPTIALSGFFIVINSLQAFDMVMAMTSGGPARATSTMVHYLYSDALSGFRVGFGSAIGVVIFFITLAFALAYRRVTRRLDVVHG
jgi:raffinose/stachyose/melibiose transport system permease protein